jgi:dihydroxyacid dehydratase/phosphogluconate dehydratase
MVMGTASTMAAMGEALGMTLPGNAAIPAVDSRRQQLAEASGRQIVRLVEQGLRPSTILTLDAFENAIRTLHAIGGSTNAIVHLIAIAGRVGLELPLRLFDALTVTGQSLRANLAGVRTHNHEVIRSLDTPLDPEGGLAVLYGSLAPDGAIIKPTAASPGLLTHRGRAVVFENHEDMEHRIDDPNLEVRPDDILVMRQGGPLGAPGMPEWGFLPLPKKLLQQGIRDMVRISDARMSGTAFGTVVVHAAPESAAGGPLAAVRTDDLIELDVPNRRLDLLVEPAEVARRLAAMPQPRSHYRRGYGWLFTRHILQADKGCDFDFLRAVSLNASSAAGTQVS